MEKLQVSDWRRKDTEQWSSSKVFLSGSTRGSKRVTFMTAQTIIPLENQHYLHRFYKVFKDG